MEKSEAGPQISGTPTTIHVNAGPQVSGGQIVSTNAVAGLVLAILGIITVLTAGASTCGICGICGLVFTIPAMCAWRTLRSNLPPFWGPLETLDAQKSLCERYWPHRGP